MGTRIYALAKELNVDSKVVLSICAELGLEGKQGALASLTDEEVAKVKARFSSRSGLSLSAVSTAATRTSEVSGPQPPTALRREDYIPPSGAMIKKVPVLDRKVRAPEKPAAVPPKSAPPIEQPAVVIPSASREVEAPVGEIESAISSVCPPTVTAEPAEVSVVKPVEQPPSLVITAGKEADRDQVVDQEKEAEKGGARELEKETHILEKETHIKEKPDKRERPEEPKRPEKHERFVPSIKLAPIPQAAQSIAPPSPPEPPPVKPDVKLPIEAIRASKIGSRPLSEYLRRIQSPQSLAALERDAKELASPTIKPTPPEARPKPKERVRERPLEKEKEKSKDRDRDKAAPRAVKESGRGRRGPVSEDDVGIDLLEKEPRPTRRKPARQREEVEEAEEPAVELTLRRMRRSRSVSTAAPRKSSVVLELPCTVRSFSEAVGIPVYQVLGKLLNLGVMATINSTLDSETAQLLAMALEVDLKIRGPQDPDQELRARFEAPDDPAELLPRAPVVTFLGHVDHGKTSLLDRILGTDVAARERGGITQHIRAYRILKDGRQIAFVDTPGHEAFTAMRARGANCTDIAVLVVAADDGVMPQTEEAIAHIRAAGVPMVVALNKIDLPGINPDRVLQQLAAHGVLPSQWGGDVEVVQTSALTGQGIDELLDTLLTVAELHELRANPHRPATGVCLEASVQPGRGVVAKLLVQRGTLRVGDILLCGSAHGRVKAMYDTLDPHRQHEEAGPSTPVDVTGLDVPPEAGEKFYVLEDIAKAREIAERRSKQQRTRGLGTEKPHLTLEELSARLARKDTVETLHIILRADVRGSLEAIQKELAKLQHPEVQIELLQAAVGAITEADVELANASDAIIIGFNVAPSEGARILAERYGVEIRRYDIIYQVTDDLKAALEGLLKPEKRQVDLGRVLVLKTFVISRVGTVAGCRVLHGIVARDARMRVVRDGRVIGDYAIQSLRREKDDVREVREGFECGIKLAGFDDVKEGDILEAYRIEEVERRL